MVGEVNRFFCESFYLFAETSRGLDTSLISRLFFHVCRGGGMARGAPAGLPFMWSVETIEKDLNFTLITKLEAALHEK
jgi:hypothetical protein